MKEYQEQLPVEYQNMLGDVFGDIGFKERISVPIPNAFLGMNFHLTPRLSTYAQVNAPIPIQREDFNIFVYGGSLGLTLGL